MKILIYGAGAVGIFLGCNLKRAGHKVALVGRRKLFSLGGTIKIDDKSYEIPQKFKKIPGSEYDIIFLTTKLYDTKDALRKISGIKHSILCVIQNGLVEPSFYGRILDDPRLVTISIFQGYNIKKDELITSKSKIGWVTQDSKRGNIIQKQLSRAGIGIHTSRHIDELRAEKMIINCAVNAVSAIYKMPVGNTITDSKTRGLVQKLYDESYEVISRIYKIPSKKVLYKRFLKIIESVGHHYSSMYQDLRIGSQTDIDFLNGYIVRMGKRLNVPVPKSEDILGKIAQLRK